MLRSLRISLLSFFAIVFGAQSLDAAAFLTFSPNRLALSGNSGQSTVSQTVMLLNTGATATDWTLSIDSSWLTASPAKGTALAAGGSVAVTLTADPSNLKPNTYSGNVTPSGTGAALPVAFTVSGTSISVLPNPIAVSVLAGTVQMFTNVGQINGTAAVSLSVTSGNSWLAAMLGGQPPAPFSLLVNATNLPPSSTPYQGGLLIRCTNAPCIAQNVAVQVTVYTPITLNCTLSTGPTQVGVAYSDTCNASGGNNSYLWSIGPGSLPSGLSLSSFTGKTVQISGTPTTAGPYNYTLALSDTSQEALKASQTFSGSIGSSSSPTFSASPSTLSFGSYTVGGTLLPAQTISLTSTNPTSGLAFTAALGSDCAWLSLSPAAGSTPATVNASVIANATPGDHSCLISFSVPGVSQIPPVTATLNVIAPVLTPAPATLSFGSYTVGGPVPPAQTISLTSANPASGMSFASALGSDCAWLALTPVAGSTPQTLNASVNPAAATPGNHSCVITFSANGVSPSPVVKATLSVGTGPVISAIVNAAGFVNGPPLAPGSWVAVFGANLAPPGDSRQWNPSTEIVNGVFPTSLDGTSVTVNGKSAAVEYISPGQVNIQLPDDTAVGPVHVVVSSATGPNASFTATYAQFAPGLFTATSSYLAVQHADGSYVGGYPGATPAKPGETIVLWGTGFGPANPTVPSGQLFTGANPLANTVNVTIGGQSATVDFAGVVGAGLVQINVRVPSGMSDGDAAVVATVGGVSTQTTGNLIAIHN
jgi:uncharacterized protein (TIGR03437 family)